MVPGESGRWFAAGRAEAIHRFKVEPRFVGSRLRRCYSGFQFSPSPSRGSRSFQLGSPHPPATQPIAPGTCSALPLSCSLSCAVLLARQAFLYCARLSLGYRARAHAPASGCCASTTVDITVACRTQGGGNVRGVGDERSESEPVSVRETERASQ